MFHGCSPAKHVGDSARAGREIPLQFINAFSKIDKQRSISRERRSFPVFTASHRLPIFHSLAVDRMLALRLLGGTVTQPFLAEAEMTVSLQRCTER
ncbi:hypothetical protein CF64_05055 [Bradyrhizobium japonicum]|nr:hypothetical protein CF64_05055 [Bradyrhizobium japonicum]